MQHEDLSKHTPQEIRSQMAETRRALVTKAEALQSEVYCQVAEAKEFLHEGIVKARRTFNLSHQVAQRPWQAMATAVVAGMVLRGIVGRREIPPMRRSGLSSAKPNRSSHNLLRRVQSSTTQPDQQSDPSVIGHLASEFGDEFRQVKKIAIGSGLELFREFAKNSLPRVFSAHIDGVAGGANERRGTKLDTSSDRSPHTVNM